MGKKVVAGVDDLKTKCPQLIKYWDYEKNGDLKPEQFSPGSNTKVFWKCDKGHPFSRQIYWMTKHPDKINCPICNNQIIVEGVNDLATTCS